MKKIFLLLLLVSIFAISANAQVTIGSLNDPDPAAVLDLQSTNLGFLPPRVELTNPLLPAPLSAHVEGMVVFNKTESDSLSIGLYYNNGTRWINLSTGSTFTAKSWFYMPSIAFKTLPVGATENVNLYEAYKRQLNETAGVVASTGAPAQALSSIPAATDLYYYVTAFDDNVFDIKSITASGMMTYEIKGHASDSTFLNIVFVEK